MLDFLCSVLGFVFYFIEFFVMLGLALWLMHKEEL
jgi:hypothetical protein